MVNSVLCYRTALILRVAEDRGSDFLLNVCVLFSCVFVAEPYANEYNLCSQFESRPVDVEYVRLMHDLQSLDIAGHTYRGYTLLTQDGRRVRSMKVRKQLM